MKLKKLAHYLELSNWSKIKKTPYIFCMYTYKKVVQFFKQFISKISKKITIETYFE